MAYRQRDLNVLRDDPNFNIDVGLLTLDEIDDTLESSHQHQIRQFDREMTLLADSSVSDATSAVFSRDSAHTATTAVSRGSFAQPEDELMGQSLGQLEFSFDQDGNAVGDVLDVDLDFDLGEDDQADRSLVPEMAPEEIPVVDLTPPKRVRPDTGKLKLRRIVVDAEISISTAKQKEDAERYRENMQLEQTDGESSFLQMVDTELAKLPPFMRFVLNPQTAVESARYSRASSVSSIEEVRRAASGESSRRESISSAQIRFSEPINELSEVAWEGDDALLDISFDETEAKKDPLQAQVYYTSLVDRCQTAGKSVDATDRSDLVQIGFDVITATSTRSSAAEQFSLLLELCSQNIVYLEPIGFNGRSKWELLQPANINIVAQV